MSAPPAIVLVDGEHYPPVTARAIAALRAAGEDPALALLVGGVEKLGQVALDLGVPVEAPADAEAGLAEAIRRVGARRVIDLSDEPVLGNVRRCRLASIALWRGAEYRGADFAFSPPHRPPVGDVPSVAVVGMGKRTGKTAVAGQAARVARAAGFGPVVVAMGRGGPPDPEVVTAGEALDPRRLLAWADAGRHAASDYIEDALTAGVPTVGAWRAGGGLAGATYFGNYDRALEAAKRLGPGLLLLEGSGASIPPARADATILVVNAGIDPANLCGYFGLFRLLLADLVVLTMVEESTALRQLSAVEDCIRNRPLRGPEVIRTIFRPHPLGDLSGRRTWFATTAGRQATTVLGRHLEEAHGATVVGVSHALADRPRLRAEIEAAARELRPDVLAVELKAAAVDVVTRFGLEHGIEVVYVDNRAHAVASDGSPASDEAAVDERLLAVAELARGRFASGAGGHEG